MAEHLDVTGWSCPLPLQGYERVVLGHGGGGKLSAELIEHLFLPAMGASPAAELRDSAVVATGGAARLAFTTDSYVVQPLFFPGGCIGDLAVNGTINDLAMSGARPIALSAGFIVEEGLPITVLGEVAEAMGKAAAAAGVAVVTGDTKVVQAGAADGLYVNTSGIGIVPDGVDVSPRRAAPGDAVIVSGPVGAHGVAVLSRREGLEFDAEIVTDSAPLHGLVAAMLAASLDVHALRDPTRGGLAASLCEIAAAAGVGIEIEEQAVPVPEPVRSACSFLGLDPFGVANEGKLVAFVPADQADAVLAAMQAHPFGVEATRIGTVTADHPRVVVARTALGARRIMDLPLGEQLPRIC